MTAVSVYISLGLIYCGGLAVLGLESASSSNELVYLFDALMDVQQSAHRLGISTQTPRQEPSLIFPGGTVDDKVVYSHWGFVA